MIAGSASGLRNRPWNTSPDDGERDPHDAGEQHPRQSQLEHDHLGRVGTLGPRRRDRASTRTAGASSSGGIHTAPTATASSTDDHERDRQHRGSRAGTGAPGASSRRRSGVQGLGEQPQARPHPGPGPAHEVRVDQATTAARDRVDGVEPRPLPDRLQAPARLGGHEVDVAGSGATRSSTDHCG